MLTPRLEYHTSISGSTSASPTRSSSRRLGEGSLARPTEYATQSRSPSKGHRQLDDESLQKRKVESKTLSPRKSSVKPKATRRGSTSMVSFAASDRAVHFRSFDTVLVSPSIANGNPQRTSRSHILHAAPSKAYYWQDDDLQKSKIFAVRIHKAASVVQALLRGFLQRKAFYKQLIAKRRQDKFDAITRVQNASAIQIQTRVRIWLARSQIQIVKFQAQLKAIEHRKLADMREIETWKKVQMKHVQKMIDVELDSFCQMKAQARVNMERIEEMRDKNKRSRERHDTLSTDIARLRSENEMLSNQNDKYSHDVVVERQNLTKWMKENEQWQYVCDLFEERVLTFEAALDERETRLALEQSQRRRYQRTVREMVKRVDRGNDESLKNLVIKALPRA